VRPSPVGGFGMSHGYSWPSVAEVCESEALPRTPQDVASRDVAVDDLASTESFDGW
jgi:hypothetical protein